MLRLQTLGGASVAGADAQPLAGATAQRRALALLSMLAASTDAGLSRDRIVGVLWPEADAARARHSLTQTMYVARRALNCDDLFIVSADIRLNPRRITSDVQEFESALAERDLERAASLYQGRFLEGFFLTGSVEFEQWHFSQQQRLEERALEVLEQLAARAEETADARSLAEYRRRITSIRPLDSRAALNFMKALAALGDRAGAYQHAQLHEQRLREQLDLAPDAMVLSFAQKLREPQAWSPGPSDQASEGGVVVVEDRTAEVLDLEDDALSAVIEPQPALNFEERLVDYRVTEVRPAVWKPVPQSVRWSRRPFATLMIASTLMLLALWRFQDPEVEIQPIKQQVLVAPFRVAGASNSLDYLREGMVELLSTRLADDTSSRSVDAGAVLGAWRSAGLTSAINVSRDTVVSLARRLGAERVVIGSIVGTPARAIMSASVVGVLSGEIGGEATVEGPTDSLTSLVDQLAAKLLVAEAREDTRLADKMTRSLRALRAYLAGQAAYRQSSFPNALQHYARALDYDSSFALAGLRSALAAERMNDVDAQRRGLVQAWSFRQSLNERDQAHLTALVGPRFPSASGVNEQMTAWDRLVGLAPNRAEAWYGLSIGILQHREQLPWHDALGRATAALRQALAVEPGFAPARHLLIRLAAEDSSVAQFADLGSRYALLDSTGSFAPFIQWRLALERHDTATLQRLRAAMSQMGPANLRMIAMASQFDAVGIEDGVRALGGLQARTATTPDLLMARHGLEVNRGRPAAALETTRMLERLDRGTHAHLRLRLLDVLYADGDVRAAEQAARDLEADNGIVTPLESLLDACVLGQWQAARGDTTRARAALNTVRSARNQPDAGLQAPAEICAHLLDASLGVALQARDALSRVQRLDTLVLINPAMGDARTYAHLLVARLYEQLGQSPQALRAIRRRPQLSGWPRYLANTWRQEGELAEKAGDVAGARLAYRKYLTLRADPEARLLPQRDQVRARASALGAINIP